MSVAFGGLDLTERDPGLGQDREIGTGQLNVLIGEAALRIQAGSAEIMQRQRNHISRLMLTATRARIGIIPFDRCPILTLHGWEQRDGIVSIETSTGDLELADPAEVAQYENWAHLLVEAAELVELNALLG